MALKAIFSATAPIVPWTGTVTCAGRLIIRDGFVGVGREPDIIIGRSITGDRAQLFLKIGRERVRKHRAETETAAENSRGIDAQGVFEKLQHVGKELMIFISTPRAI